MTHEERQRRLGDERGQDAKLGKPNRHDTVDESEEWVCRILRSLAHGERTTPARFPGKDRRALPLGRALAQA